MAFYGILWHFGIFAKKSNKKSNPIYPIFPILSDFFGFLDFSRLLDFPILQLYSELNWIQPWYQKIQGSTKTSQELRMLSSVTLDCHVTKIVI